MSSKPKISLNISSLKKRNDWLKKNHDFDILLQKNTLQSDIENINNVAVTPDDNSEPEKFPEPFTYTPISDIPAYLPPEKSKWNPTEMNISSNPHQKNINENTSSSTSPTKTVDPLTKPTLNLTSEPRSQDEEESPVFSRNIKKIRVDPDPNNIPVTPPTELQTELPPSDSMEAESSQPSAKASPEKGIKTERYSFTIEENAQDSSKKKLLVQFNKLQLGPRILRRSRRNETQLQYTGTVEKRATRGQSRVQAAPTFSYNEVSSGPKRKKTGNKEPASSTKRKPFQGETVTIESLVSFYSQYDQNIEEPPLLTAEDINFPEDDEMETSKTVYTKHKKEVLRVFESRKKAKETGATIGFREAAIYILSLSERLLSCEQIVHRALKWGLMTTEGKTPHATMSARMNTDISKNGADSIFRKFGLGKFSIRTKFSSHIAQNILSDSEKEYGMTLLKGSALKFIPANREEDWLEAKLSNIPDSGLGLFAKRDLQNGTVFCEYRGIIRDNEGGDIDLHPYGISVTMPDGSTKMIDGIDEQGNVHSMAPRANDAGPKFANCVYSEYSEHPGRVFLEASQNIQAGQEIFVNYGPAYWGCKQYPDINSPSEAGTLMKYSNRFVKRAKQKKKIKDQELLRQNSSTAGGMNESTDANNNLNASNHSNSLLDEEDLEIDESLLMLNDDNSKDVPISFKTNYVDSSENPSLTNNNNNNNNKGFRKNLKTKKRHTSDLQDSQLKASNASINSLLNFGAEKKQSQPNKKKTSNNKSLSSNNNSLNTNSNFNHNLIQNIKKNNKQATQYQNDNNSQPYSSQNNSSQNNFAQNNHPQNNYAQNNYAQNNYAQNNYPPNNYPPNNYPQNNHPQNNYPQNNYPQNDYPQNDYVQNNHPQNNYAQNPQNNYPQNNYPQNNYLQNNLSQNNYPQNNYVQNSYSQNQKYGQESYNFNQNNFVPNYSQQNHENNYTQDFSQPEHQPNQLQRNDHSSNNYNYPNPQNNFTKNLPNRNF